MFGSSLIVSASKGEKLAQRLSNILARLHQGQMLDKHQLSQEFQVDVRTIERDLKDRLTGLVQRNDQGHWELTHAARSTVPAKYLEKYAKLTGTEKLFPDSSLNYLLEQITQTPPERVTHVQTVAYEDLRPHTQEFAQLEAAIQQHCHCYFSYKAKPRVVRPYKLIHKNGIWYLAAEEGSQLKIFSVALIEKLRLDESVSFVPKPAHLQYIASTEDVWFTEATTEVLLRVSKDVAHYFTRRALLPQQNHRFDRDGSLLVTAHINHMHQLLPVVRYWLPHVRIIEPQAWHEELGRSLVQALETMNFATQEVMV